MVEQRGERVYLRHRQDRRDLQRSLLLSSLAVEEGEVEVVEGSELLFEARDVRVVGRRP